MAVVCMQCKMLCVIFFLICGFSSIYSASDIYLDNLDKDSSYFIYNIEKEQAHILRKRSSSERLLSEPTTETTPSKSSIVLTPKSEPAAYDSSEALKDVKEKDKGKKPYDSKVLLNKNLGVNGTGIRKNITETTPIPVVNVSISSNTTVVPITTESVSVVSKTNQSLVSDEDDLSYSNVFDETYNKTMAEHNITKTTEDHHQFYNSTLTQDPVVGHKYWINLNNRSDVKVSDLLSQSHRRAATVRLSFEFPFYGHLVRNITIATGGFLYTGEYVHSWLAATQYIAPLMANFDTSISNDSYIKYLDNGTAFTVQWEKVALQDKPNAGNFTFQTTLFKNGDIVFVYENIPITIEDIQDDHHPVKVGLSDAYISDRTIFFVRRKTIYEYHRVNFNRQDIRNWTSIYLSALPTCLSNKDCVSCVSKYADLKCMWCPGVNRCSSGMDRNRQGWLSRGCERKKITDEAMCATAEIDDGVDLTNSTGDNDLLPHYKTAVNHGDHAEQQPGDQPQQQPRITQSEKPVSMGVSSIVTILFLISLVLGLGVWVMYAYRNPHSTSGQILIRYRPSQWSFKRGEARYTAATIHM